MNELKDENYSYLPKSTNKTLHFVPQQKGLIKKGLYNLQLGVEKVPTIKAEKE